MGHWFRLGELELCVVSDGVIRQDAGATFGLVPRVMWERYTPDLDDKNRIPVGNNSLLVRSAGKTVLLDTGVGTKPTRAPGAMDIEASGKLFENLSARGRPAREIDVVVNTHLHFDHCGGNTPNRRRQARARVPASPLLHPDRPNGKPRATRTSAPRAPTSRKTSSRWTTRGRSS